MLVNDKCGTNTDKKNTVKEFERINKNKTESSINEQTSNSNTNKNIE